MKIIHDLSALDWRLTGWTPHFWRFSGSVETGSTALAEVPPVPAAVPGSVQAALRDAGLLPDWNVGLNARLCEWVENRHWIFEALIPDEWLAEGSLFVLRALGLDYRGTVLVNGLEAGTFRGSLVPHAFDLTPHLTIAGNNRVAIVFEGAPRWLGQFGYTSRMTEWKPRFNYTWDWVSRLVQLGIWDDLTLEVSDATGIDSFRCFTEVSDAGTGTLRFQGAAAGANAASVRVTLERSGEPVRSEKLSTARLAEWNAWDDLRVDLWHPNGAGGQPAYRVTCELLDAGDRLLDLAVRSTGFKRVEWLPCEGAPPDADPWLCAVNGRPLFLQGVNWSPIRPNFADVSEEEYRARLETYRDLGCNMLRVWGGSYLEKECFYRICDELGLLVWQEFPLSSSGIDNWPPEDETSIAELAGIARSYIERRQNHVSLLMWCGGNELQGSPDGSKTGTGRPVDTSHPLLRRFAGIVAEEDPTRRYVPTSSSGPRFYADEAEMGRGLHWDVHGPWISAGDLSEGWTRYWEKDDALFRSETGSPGASPLDIVRNYRGDCDEFPCSVDNPIWRRTAWWVEWPAFVEERGHEPETLEEYIDWSQERQARALSIAVGACKARFPRCGGILLWMGHDCFPCTANTSILDFHGRPKPAAEALGRIWRLPTTLP